MKAKLMAIISPALMLVCLGFGTTSALMYWSNYWAAWDVYFTPKDNATAVIVQAIDNAKIEIKVQAYYLTSTDIADALIRAADRDVHVNVILDRVNTSSPFSQIEVLASEGVHVSIDTKHAIAHSKVIIIDKQLVITGSFNFTVSAQKRNAENMIILGPNKVLAAEYLENWQRCYTHSQPFQF